MQQNESFSQGKLCKNGLRSIWNGKAIKYVQFYTIKYSQQRLTVFIFLGKIDQKIRANPRGFEPRGLLECMVKSWKSTEPKRRENFDLNTWKMGNIVKVIFRSKRVLKLQKMIFQKIFFGDLPVHKLQIFNDFRCKICKIW